MRWLASETLDGDTEVRLATYRQNFGPPNPQFGRNCPNFGQITNRVVKVPSQTFSGRLGTVDEVAVATHANAQVAEDVDFIAAREGPSLDFVDENDLF